MQLQYVVVKVVADVAGLSRDEVVAVLRAENVLARRYFSPSCHRMESYCSDVRTVATSLPVTERLANSDLALPTGIQLDEHAISRIGEILSDALENASTLRSRLARRQAA